MKEINLYVIGKYEYSSRVGNWICYLEYRGAVRKCSGYINNGQSSSYTALFGIMQALGYIKEPCFIHMHSRANLGFNNPNRSVNSDILKQIQHMIVHGGHRFTHDNRFDDTSIERWEQDNKRIRMEAENNKVEQLAEQCKSEAEWKSMYEDLLGSGGSTWVKGSGGY